MRARLESKPVHRLVLPLSKGLQRSGVVRLVYSFQYRIIGGFPGFLVEIIADDVGGYTRPYAIPGIELVVGNGGEYPFFGTVLIAVSV